MAEWKRKELAAGSKRLLTIIGRLEIFLDDSPYPRHLTSVELSKLKKAQQTIMEIESRLYMDSQE